MPFIIIETLYFKPKLLNILNSHNQSVNCSYTHFDIKKTLENNNPFCNSGCTIIAVAVLVLVVFLAIARSVCKSYPPSMEKRKEKHPINNHYGTLAEGQIVVQTTKY